MMKIFSDLRTKTMLFLFNSFCSPDFGLALWNSNNSFNRQIYQSFKIAYVKAIKLILRIPHFSSTHFAANKCELLIFKHHTMLNQLRYLCRLNQSKNILIHTYLPFLKSGLFFSHFNKCFFNSYDVRTLDNDIQALVARIWFVQRTEPRSRVCPYYGE